MQRCMMLGSGSGIRGHVEHASAAKVGGMTIDGCEAKVGKLCGPAIVPDEDVLRLQIAMIDAMSVAVAYCVENLQKDRTNFCVLADIRAIFCDLGEQVTFRAVFENNVCAVRCIPYLFKTNNVRVRCRGRRRGGRVARTVV